MSEEQRRAFAGWLRAQGRPVRRVAVLSGAGISAESGVPTFRGDDGLWRALDPMALFTPEALARMPERAWELYDALRVRIAGASPNAGHAALAALEAHCAVTVATQNIDGLHQRAGSTRVLEIHGTLWTLRCTVCRHREENTLTPLPACPPHCPRCAAVLRPDIVFFTESLPEQALAAAWQAAEACDLMLVVGTSGIVYPAAAIPGIARRAGALVVEVNPLDTAISEEMHFAVRATAAESLPWMAEVLAG